MRKTPIAAAAAAVLAASAVFAADAAKEIEIAAAHAGLAAQAKAIAAVHAHLHHAVNCLAGPGGAEFDTTQLNPCSGLGGGAIPDTADAAKKKLLEDALARAKEGLAQSDLYAATRAAAKAQELLKQAK